MTNRSKSCPPTSRSGSKKRRVQLDHGAKPRGLVVGGRMPTSNWLGRREGDETNERGNATTNNNSSPLHFLAQSSLQGVFWESNEEWESKSYSDSSYTNLSETEASWLLAFDDIMSQVSSKVSGMDELLDVLSFDGEDPNPSTRYSVSVETKASPLRPKAKRTNRNKEDSSNGDVTIWPRLCAYVEGFTIEDKFNCIDSSGFWETFRSAFGAHCDDAGDFLDKLQAKSREKMETISRLDSTSMDGRPIIRTSSGRRVQFEFDMRPIPFWARRSWRRRSGRQVIPKSNNDKAAATSCLKNSKPAEPDGSWLRTKPPIHSRSHQPSTEEVRNQPIGLVPSETLVVEDETVSMSSIVETKAENETTLQANYQKQNSTSTSKRKPKLKLFISVARKVLPFPKRSDFTREKILTEVKSSLTGDEVETSIVCPPVDHILIDYVPDPVAPKTQRVPDIQETPLVPPTTQRLPKTQGTPLVPEKPQEANSVPPMIPKAPLPVTVGEKVVYDLVPGSPLQERTRKGSLSSNNSTLLEDWSSYSSKTSEDSTGLECRVLKRFSNHPPDPPGTYSPSKYSPEGLTIECQNSVESQEETISVERRKDIQPFSSRKAKRTNPQTSTKRIDVHSISSQKPHKKNSQILKTRKLVRSVSSQKFNRTIPQAPTSRHDFQSISSQESTRTNPQEPKPRKVIQSLSSQQANTTNKPIARLLLDETTSSLVTEKKVDGETGNWFNFDELDDDGFPTNHFRVEEKENCA